MVSQQQHSTYTKISTQSRKMNKISNNIHIYYILYFFIYMSIKIIKATSTNPLILLRLINWHLSGRELKG